VAKRSRSGLKHKRQSEKRRVGNQAVLSRLKTLTKGPLTTPDRLAQALSELDRAARKGIIPQNTAARKKSRLMQRLTTGTREQGNTGTKATS